MGVVSSLSLFIDLTQDQKFKVALAVVFLILVGYLVIWNRLNTLKELSINVDNSTVKVIVGDLFTQVGLKVIPFNEYFDTIVDDRIISRSSLNGQFITREFPDDTRPLDEFIDKYSFADDEFCGEDADRPEGKTKRYRIGTLCVKNDFVLAAFAKFDRSNRAVLTMPEYLEFLISFWDRINRVYAQKDVYVPIFGSGITRILGHKSILDEELLKIMIWTYRVSEMRFKHPAKLTIVIHSSKIDQVNLAGLGDAGLGL